MFKEINGNTVIVPPFTEESARAKVKAAQDGWNSLDPERVALAYTEDSLWRNRAEFFQGREAIKAFLRRKWAKETQYRLMKELWCYQGNRISVRFEYEYFDVEASHWMRAHGNEHWEFDDAGLMRRRDMSANEYPIAASERRYAQGSSAQRAPTGTVPGSSGLLYPYINGTNPSR